MLRHKPIHFGTRKEKVRSCKRKNKMVGQTCRTEINTTANIGVCALLGLDEQSSVIVMSRPEIGLHKKVNLWTLKNKPFWNT